MFMSGMATGGLPGLPPLLLRTPFSSLLTLFQPQPYSTPAQVMAIVCLQPPATTATRCPARASTSLGITWSLKKAGGGRGGMSGWGGSQPGGTTWSLKQAGSR